MSPRVEGPAAGPVAAGRVGRVAAAVADAVADAAALERRLFEVLGGWVPTVPEPEAKLLLRVHSFQHAWHAELWDGLGRAVRPWAATGWLEGVSAAVDEMAVAERTVDRLTGAYRVVLPRLAGEYSDLLAATSPETAGPLLRILRLVLADGETAGREGESLLEHLLLREGTASSKMD